MRLGVQVRSRLAARYVTRTTMLTSLLEEARSWLPAWQRRLACYWLAGKDHLAFVAMIALLIGGVLGVIYLAYLDGTRIEPVRIQALQQAEIDARRRANDLQCLAENIYFEARGEPLEGQYAVAEVTLNRTRARNFPRSICAVVHEARWDPDRRRLVADFSWTAFAAASPPEGAAWEQAMRVATAVYDDLHDPVVPGALFYHAISVRPEWSRSRRAVARIGNHIFYR